MFGMFRRIVFQSGTSVRNMPCVRLFTVRKNAMPTKAISAIPLSIFLFLQGLLITLPAIAQEPGKEASKPEVTSQSAELHLGKGYEAMRNERYAEAVQEFRAALAIDSTLVMRARFPLGVALYEQRNYPASRAELRKSARRQASCPASSTISAESIRKNTITNERSRISPKPPLRLPFPTRFSIWEPLI
jgi:hypothetical protein